MAKKAKPATQQLDTRVLATLIENVRRRREVLGLSQGQTSLAAGLENHYVYHLENNRNRDPGLQTLVKLAKALKTTPAKLLTQGGWRED